MIDIIKNLFPRTIEGKVINKKFVKGLDSIYSDKCCIKLKLMNGSIEENIELFGEDARKTYSRDGSCIKLQRGFCDDYRLIEN